MRQCAKCGTQNASERDFCTNCGEYLRWDPTGFMPAAPAAPAGPAGAPPAGQPPAQPPLPLPPGVVYPPPAAPQAMPQAPPPVHQAPPPPQAQPVAAEPVVITLRAPGIEVGGPPTVQVEPGGSIQVVALIRNQSGIVDNYDLEIEGLPSGWCSVSPPIVYLIPFGSGAAGYEQEVTIELRPPRAPEAEARPWPFQLVAKSKAQGGARVGAGRGTLVIGPFTEFTTDIRPQKGAGRRGATFTITVRNKANAPVDVNLTASEHEETHRFEFEDEKDRVSPAPGKSAITRVRVTPPKMRWIGSPKDVRFEVHPQVVGVDQPVPSARGTFVHKAWLPRYVSYVVPFLIAAAVGLYITWRHSEGPAQVAVPDLTVAKSTDGAEKLLKSKKLVLDKEVKEEETKDFVPGTIFDQDPDEGEVVDEGSTVKITIAVGSEQRKVPKLVGLTLEDATQALEEAGLVLGRVTPSEPERDATIEDQSPKAGDEKKEGSPINVFFEEAPEEETTASAEESADSSAAEDSTGGDESSPAGDSSGAEDTSNGGDSGGDTDGGGGGDQSGAGGAAGAAKAAVGKSAEEAQAIAKAAGVQAAQTVVVSAKPVGEVVEAKEAGGGVQLAVSGGYPPLAYDQNGDILVAEGASGKDPKKVASSDEVEEQPAWNADGTLIAYRRGADDTGRIWVVDPRDPQSAHPLTAEGFDDRRPAFSPNGKVIAFARGATKDVDHDLCFIGVGSTTGQPQCVADPTENVSRPDWSPDGQSILVVSSPVENATQVEATLYTTPTANSPKAANWLRQSVVTDPFHGAREGDQVLVAIWSPDGTRVAFTANWGKDFFHVWLAKVEDGVISGKPQPILKIQACEASWRFDGAELVFTQRDNFCNQAGAVKRVDPRSPADQTTLTKLVGASNPTWAPLLPGGEKQAAAGGDAGGGEDPGGGETQTGDVTFG